MAITAENNPLNPFKSDGPTSTSVEVPEYPKLEQLISEKGFKEGLRAFDEQMEQHRQQLQRTINERLQGKSAAVQSGGVE